ncbi:MAG: 30S ribosomal protein S3 [Candidatus Pacearchaeota archaeon]|nr:30S ribosomal protein S3 [Candidatus Pacearchaeota archaeon]
MIEKKFVEAKKQEFEIKEFVKMKVGKGKVSDVKIERTPIGEKIVVITAKPGLVIGRGGELIQEINDLLKKRFKLENPQIEVSELPDPVFDAQGIADQIALTLEKFGPLSFKLIAYKELEKLAKAGALGAEIRLNGKLPSERAKSWRFAFGYLKKTGANEEIVNSAKATAFTKPGAIGIKVSVVPKGRKMPDKIEINYELVEKELKEKIKETEEEIKREEEKIKENKEAKKRKTMKEKKEKK